MKKLGLLIVLCLIITSFACDAGMRDQALVDRINEDELEPIILDNGLEVYLLENHTVPLVTIQVAVRHGSIGETEDSFGYAHLYEHMMFKSNKDFPTEDDFKAAQIQMGVSSLNGGTSTEYVEYHFSIPVSELENGLSFWASALRYTIFDSQELEIEKQVVINEIQAREAESDTKWYKDITQTFFREHFYRKWPLGSVQSIEEATVEDMLSIKNTYYVPNNCSVMVAGDINKIEALALVEKYYGDWEKAADPWENALPPHPPFDQNRYVLSTTGTNPGMIEVVVEFRGPDVLEETEDTYAADVWGTLISNPQGNFIQNLNKPEIGHISDRYINGYYYTQRDGGQISFSTMVHAYDQDEGLTLQERIALFVDTLKEEIDKMVNQPDYFSDEEIESAKQQMEDSFIYSKEAASSYARNILFWWAVSSSDYYQYYLDNIKQMQRLDLNQYLNQYLKDEHYLLGVRISPLDQQSLNLSIEEL